MPLSAEEQIHQAILDQGKITFARFMELALYAPGVGYYTGWGGGVGEEGDFVTAPSVHPVFGALLSLQLEQMWELLDRPPRFTVVEPGAGSGILAQDILQHADAQQPQFARCLHYVALERSRPLSREGSFTPHWVTAAQLPLRGVVGCILANELLDAFPVQRFVARGEQILEVYVALRDGALVEELDAPSTPLLAERIHALGGPLPEGFQGEVNLALEGWMEGVARGLERGFVLVLDYGGTAEEIYAPHRKHGTLRSYYRHAPAASPYQRIARQDLTAHVDFTLVEEAGRRHGLRLLGYTEQRQFLRNLGMDAFFQALRLQVRRQRELYANQMAMRELVRPDGMGDFKVLALGKGVPEIPLHGFSEGNSLQQRLRAQRESLEAPLATGDHVRMLEAKYPHLVPQFQEGWPGPV